MSDFNGYISDTDDENNHRTIDDYTSAINEASSSSSSVWKSMFKKSDCVVATVI